MLRRLFTKTALNRWALFKVYIAKNAAIYSSWMCLPELNSVCLPPFLSLPLFPPPLLALVLSLPQSHTSYLFSLQSPQGPLPLIVSQTGTGEEKVTGISGCMHQRETGKAEHNSLKGRKSLSHIAAHIHLRNDRLKFAEFRSP